MTIYSSISSSSPAIILNQVTYKMPNSTICLEQVGLSFMQKKYAIIGENGIGKTTLLNLISGKLKPLAGNILCNAKIEVMPQSYKDYNGFNKFQTIADILGVSARINALKNIEKGSINQEDYDLVGDNWDLETQISDLLKPLSLNNINLNTLFINLSGGQKTKILLAKIKLASQLSGADFILLDEPSNNLDKNSRMYLYDFINNHNKGLIISSHDRELLKLVDVIIELTSLGVNIYGGNYDFYLEQKQLKQDALNQEYEHAKRVIKKSKTTIQATREKHEKRASKGRKAFLDGKIDRLSANAARGRSEKTKSKMCNQEDKIIKDNQAKLKKIQEQIEVNEDLKADLKSTYVPNGKMVLDINNLNFKYINQNIFTDFNFNITGPDRVAITGPNGCGKSTLIKLIRNQITPLSGEIKIGVKNIAYLDQEVSFLDKNLSLVDNYLKLNLNTQAIDAYAALAKFKFRNIAAEKLVKHLSGGERMRAGLAISLLCPTPPQLIILDEPTNHLDLKSICAIEQALSAYQGAILAVSHDEVFLENIGVHIKTGL